MARLLVAISGLALAGCLSLPCLAADASSQLLTLTREFVAAQRGFDQARLEALLAPDYLEISPLGEVDLREEVIGFYSPEAKAKVAAAAGAQLPRIALDEERVRVFGDNAMVTLRESFRRAGQDRAMRVSFHFRRIDGAWKLQSSQYTPIREPAH